MTPEGLVKKKIKDILNAKGAYYTMPLGTGMVRQVSLTL